MEVQGLYYLRAFAGILLEETKKFSHAKGGFDRKLAYQCLPWKNKDNDNLVRIAVFTGFDGNFHVATAVCFPGRLLKKNALRSNKNLKHR